MYLLILFIRYHLFDKTAAERRWVDDNPTVGSVLVHKIAENVPFSNPGGTKSK